MDSIRFILICLGCTLLIQCQPPAPESQFPLSRKHQLLFLDSAQAARDILVDETEAYFDKVRPLDMLLQLKIPVEGGVPARDSLMKLYKRVLQEEVSDFTDKEKLHIQGVFKTIYFHADKMNIPLFTEATKLIKLKGELLGPSVYFTRDNIILIPQPALSGMETGNFTDVMIHELIHIANRYNPLLKDTLYGLIGFQELTDSLIFPEPLDRKILLNPDGIDMGYYIELQPDSGEMLKAIPAIYANANSYHSSQPNFFDYIEFDLFEIQPSENGWLVLADSTGGSTIEPTELNDFFNQITDNTDYIIHPDEIIADNFVLLFQPRIHEGEPLNLSLKGAALQARLKALFNFD